MNVLARFVAGRSAGALLVALAAVPRAARAQRRPRRPATTPAPSRPAAPGNDAPPAPRRRNRRPRRRPAVRAPGQPGSPPPAPGYPPGYAPPRVTPRATRRRAIRRATRPRATRRPTAGADPRGVLPASPPRRRLHLDLGLRRHRRHRLKLSGGGPRFAIAVGGAVAPNLAVFGNLFFTGAAQPKRDEQPLRHRRQASGNAWSGGSARASSTTSCRQRLPLRRGGRAELPGRRLERQDLVHVGRRGRVRGDGREGVLGLRALGPRRGAGVRRRLVDEGQERPERHLVRRAFNVVFSATYF